MRQVRFYEQVPDEALKYAVIAARAKGRWVFCRHRARHTRECPGGRREPGESIEARRELYGETGALAYTLAPVCVCAVTGLCALQPQESCGMLYAAGITALEGRLHSEIAEIALLEQPPRAWTYPEIQPLLLQKALRRGCFA